MASPARPALKRQNSKVRFSRTDMSPIGTMASDSTVHGVHGQHTQPSQYNYATHPQPTHASHSQHAAQQPGNPYEQEEYDINQYPFSEEIALSTSEAPDDPAYYREVPTEEDEPRHQPHHRDSHSHPPSVQTYDPPSAVDGYTSTPPRGGSRRWSLAQRPGLDTLLSADAIEPAPIISPRGSTMLYDNAPSANASPRLSHSAASPQRPALRSSLVMHPPSPETRDPRAHYEYSGGSPYRGARASLPNISTPPRRGLETHRASAPEGSPFGSPAFGSPRAGGSPSLVPAIRRYPEYEHPPDRFSPVPPYQSPRGSFARDARDARESREWDEKKYADRYTSRHDSDATLQGEYEKSKPSAFEGGLYRRRSNSQDSARSMLAPAQPYDTSGMRRRTTREMEGNADDDGDSYKVKGGVFSQLLRLTGRSNTLRRRQLSRGASSQGAGELPTMKTLGLKRNSSTTSTVWGADEFDADDPRVTGQKKKKGRRNSWSELPFTRRMSTGTEGGAKKKRRASISLHVADILTRQQFIIKLAKALMSFGAPSHRIESQLAATALVLEVDAQFIHFPSIVIASFGDVDTRTSETHFVKAGGGLDLGKLHKVHNIYKCVVHDEMDAAEGTRRIQALLKAPMEYGLWQRVVLAFLCSGIIAPLGFGGSFIDGLASGVLGILLSFMQLQVASKSAMYSNIFEISIATVISFTARGLATTGIFCYQAVASAGVVLILPGYTILCGSLELASKNIVSGSVRMVYAIIYSLFLGFGITIGSDLFYVLDRPARRAANAAVAAANSAIVIRGTFSPTELLESGIPTLLNATTPFIPFNGTFTFSNSTVDSVNSNLQQGAIICVRPDGLPWYRQGMPQIYLIALVPAFSILLSMWNMQPLRSRQLPVMVTISCIGFLTNTLANHYIFDRSDVVSAIGAFVIGILGNIYSRVFGGTAFTSMVTGVLFLVPSGIAAAGGLAMTNNPHKSESYNQGLIIGFRMVQVAIGITVGLFGSGLLIYSFGRKKGAALFAF